MTVGGMSHGGYMWICYSDLVVFSAKAADLVTHVTDCVNNICIAAPLVKNPLPDVELFADWERRWSCAEGCSILKIYREDLT